MPNPDFYGSTFLNSRYVNAAIQFRYSLRIQSEQSVFVAQSQSSIILYVIHMELSVMEQYEWTIKWPIIGPFTESEVLDHNWLGIDRIALLVACR